MADFPIPDPASIQTLLGHYGFRQDTAALLAGTARDVSPELATFCRTWPENPNRAEEAARFTGLQQALAVVTAFPAMERLHRACGLPETVTHATARDLERWMDDYRKRTGAPGFDRLRWLRNHVTGGLYEIGRLQYAPGQFAYPFDLWRDPATGLVTAFARPGLNVTREGWTVKENGAWQARQDRVDGVLHGYPVDPGTGRVRQEWTPIRGTCVLDEHSHVLAVHIPAGDRLTREAALASLREARDLFSRHFASINYRAWCTATWLLDRALEVVLPPHSNILAFGRLFSPLPVRDADGKQHLERIFGPQADWQTAPLTTSLQRAAAEYLRSGGEFRMMGGFILFDELERLEAEG